MDAMLYVWRSEDSFWKFSPSAVGSRHRTLSNSAPYNTFFFISFFDPIAQKWYPGEDNTETEGWVMVARQDEQQ